MSLESLTTLTVDLAKTVRPYIDELDLATSFADLIHRTKRSKFNDDDQPLFL